VASTRDDPPPPGVGQVTAANFAGWLESVQRPLFSFLRGMLEHDEHALDVMQDTFCEAWRVARRSAAPFTGDRDDRECRRWLFHVAYHRAISLVRRQRIIRWQSLEEDGIAEVAGAVSFEDAIIETQAMQAALQTLSPDDVASLLLIVVHGFTAAETGQIVGASAAAVAKRFARAKQRLREVYQAQNAAPEAERTLMP
jgi:RNA polymerase sigma factor (sigma-70 family)